MVRLSKKLTLNKVELIEFQIRAALPKLKNQTEVRVLAYVHVYGKQAKVKMMLDELFKSKNSMENYISNLRKSNLIIGLGDDLTVNSKITLFLEDLHYSFEIQLTT